MDFDGLETGKPTVLLIATVTDGITSKIKSSEWQYKEKSLNSSPENWVTICDLFSQFKIMAVIIRIDDSAYHRFIDPDYSQVASELLRNISEVKNLIFTFDRRGGEERDLPELPYEAPFPASDDIRHKVENLFRVRELNLVTYRRTSEMTMSGIAFLADLEIGLILRVYIPHSQLWSSQSSRLVELLRNYLTLTGSPGFSISETTTSSGRCCEFRSRDGMTLQGFKTSVEDFEEFVNLCVRDSLAAENQLLSLGLSKAATSEMINRYSTEARRLLLDLRQEKEKRMLSITHRLEAELSELVNSNSEDSPVNILRMKAAPSVSHVISGFFLNQISAAALDNDLASENQFLTDRVRAIVWSELNGEERLSTEERQLLQLIRSRGGPDQVRVLVSAVHELLDNQLPRSTRQNAMQLLRAFLSQVTTDVSGGLLLKWLERVFGL
ncbi:hypothetical protein GC163_04440 [bacterium]|nr:hypothetical protein [bacterium]